MNLLLAAFFLQLHDSGKPKMANPNLSIPRHLCYDEAVGQSYLFKLLESNLAVYTGRNKSSKLIECCAVSGGADRQCDRSLRYGWPGFQPTRRRQQIQAPPTVFNWPPKISKRPASNHRVLLLTTALFVYAASLVSQIAASRVFETPKNLRL